MFDNLRDFRLTGDGYNVILQDFSKVSIDLDLPSLGIDLARAIDELDIKLPVLKIEQDGNGRYVLVLVNGDVLTWPVGDDEELYLGKGVDVSISNDNGYELDAVDNINIKLAVSQVMPDDLTDIVGLGQTYKERLNAVGIVTFEQLARADAETVAEATEAHLSIVKNWKIEARKLMSGNEQ